MTKKEGVGKKYGLLSPIALESDGVSLSPGLCASGGSLYNKDTIKNTLSGCTQIDRPRETSHAGSKYSKSQIRQQHPSKICFITSGWQVTHDLNFLKFTMVVEVNSNTSLKNIHARQL
jgi:hypothetical protein